MSKKVKNIDLEQKLAVHLNQQNLNEEEGEQPMDVDYQDDDASYKYEVDENGLLKRKASLKLHHVFSQNADLSFVCKLKYHLDKSQQCGTIVYDQAGTRKSQITALRTHLLKHGQSQTKLDALDSIDGICLTGTPVSYTCFLVLFN